MGIIKLICDRKEERVRQGRKVTAVDEGPALAFGGTDGPTFLDCLNVLGHADAGDVAASRPSISSASSSSI